ncbi:hypothetical protein G6F62_006536 [Rhizopus arrhizus]|nr:hypothetical protein G6F18_011086 [Rhizopus arrhizus]KAG1335734.1 hypothetical protein G6F62_006536 [Rhizopus arrhizus]
MGPRKPLDEDYIDIDDTYDEHQDDTNTGGYAWEEEYKRSWDVLQEDAEGNLSSVVSQLQQQRKRRRLLKDTDVIQRGIIRHVFIIIDLSEAMNEKDLRPSRIELTLTYAQQFVVEFFDQNPISQLGIIITRDGIAEKLTELSGNPTDHIKALKSKKNTETSGEPSLQNALQLARASMLGVPSHGSKEVLLIFGSLTTCDPSDIHDTIDLLKKELVRVNVVGLAAEVQICRALSKKTKGTYGVVLNEAHFKDLLFEVVPPPAVMQNKNTSNLIKMGFPKRLVEDNATFCVCHSKLTMGGYICPRCKSKVCELPSDCDICGLTLVSSPHLARSYHHLFPVDNFDEVKNNTSTKLWQLNELKSIIDPHKDHIYSIHIWGVRDSIVQYILSHCSKLKHLTICGWTTLSDHSLHLVPNQLLELKSIKLIGSANKTNHVSIDAYTLAKFILQSPQLNHLVFGCQTHVHADTFLSELEKQTSRSHHLKSFTLATKKTWNKDHLVRFVDIYPTIERIQLVPSAAKGFNDAYSFDCWIAQQVNQIMTDQPFLVSNENLIIYNNTV